VLDRLSRLPGTVHQDGFYLLVTFAARHLEIKLTP
jgi:hypothetical protein